jgi:hypothetical protein
MRIYNEDSQYAGYNCTGTNSLLITTGVALARRSHQGSTVDQAIDHIAEGDFSTTSEGKHNNILAIGDAATSGREKNPVSGINSTIADSSLAGEKFPLSSDLELFFNDTDLDNSATTRGDGKFTQDVRSQIYSQVPE